MITKRFILLAGVVSLLSACVSSPEPVVYKHPETKNIILLQGDTLQCEPLFRKAGFQKVNASMPSD